MRTDKLQDAIGMIDSDLVARAGEERSGKRKKYRLKWTASIAAVLAVVIGVGVFFGNTPAELSGYAITEAEYPSMAEYPGDESLIGFNKKYEAWIADIKKQREYIGAGKELDDFFEATISEFLSGGETENRIYSPLNVYMALAMLAEITDGNSRRQILDLIGVDNIEMLRTQAHAVWNANYSDDGAVTSILASSLWLNNNIQFKKDTLETLAKSYYASAYQGEMGSSEYSESLHDWLNEQTGGLLGDYISDIEMTPETIMTIASTIYFRAKWDAEFSESETTKEVFHAAAGDVVCDFMHQTENFGTVYWGEDFSAAGKSLQESGNMWFILPDEGVSVNELLASEEVLSFLTSNGDWENNKMLKVNMSIPKFDISSKLDLKQGLKNLGVTDCFDWAVSDFTPLLSDEEKVILSEIKHGARVTIDEEGVTATAYTAMLLAGSAMPPKDEIDFIVDRPFIFVITGIDGLPLFVGVVNQP